MTSPYLNQARGGLTERPHVNEMYRKVERLWFEVREMNLRYDIVDTVEELFSLANTEAEIEQERSEAYDEKEKLETQIETLERERDALQTKVDNLEIQLEQAAEEYP